MKRDSSLPRPPISRVPKNHLLNLIPLAIPIDAASREQRDSKIKQSNNLSCQDLCLKMV